MTVNLNKVRVAPSSAFKSGAEWKGNSNGRPKKSYCRDDFTDEIFLERKDDIRIVAEKLFVHAKNDSPWAIKLVLEYFLTRPKNKESAEESANNNELVDKLKTMPSAKLVAIHKMLSEEIDSDVSN